MLRNLAAATALTVAALACRPAEPDASQAWLDDTGRPVSAGRPARRIVSLAPSLTELLFAIGAGDRVVGRTRWCDYPPRVSDVPSVGDGLHPNVEMIAAQRPDWVMFYASPSNDPVIEQLEHLGVATLSLRTDRFADLARAARLMGSVTGTGVTADSLVNDLERELADLESTRPPGDPPSVLLLAWDDPPIVIGGESFLSEIVRLAGARNVFGDVTRPSATVGIEVIAERDPDIVLVTADSTEPGWAARPEWSAVRAVRERTFRFVTGSAYSRPSFRGPRAVRRLRAVLMEGAAVTRWLLLAASALAAVAIGLAVGPAEVGFAEVWDAVRGRGDETTVAIVRDLRLPRVLLAFVVGGCLAVTGAALQALVRNPLADPYLLGLSGGAGLGAVLAIVLGVGGAWGLPAAALVGALLAIALVYRLALVSGSVLDARVLLLSGVVVGAFAASMMGAIMALSKASDVRNALLWMLGGFDRASWRALGVFGAYAVIPLGVLYRQSRPLDLLSLGEEPARYLGADVERLKRLLYVAASILTAAAVAVSGIIGFVGLVVPHAIRLLWGHTHQSLLPAAFLLGGALLALADAVARTVFAPMTLPVGVVTALIGVPVFVVLVRAWAT